MKIGFLSDAHGNVEGFLMCLQFLQRQGVARLMYLGDLAGYLPDGDKVIDILNDTDAIILLGNHDAMLLGCLPLSEEENNVYRLRETQESLGQQQIAQIQRMLPYWCGEVDRRKLLCVHGSPWDPLRGYVYPDSDLHPFAQLPFDVVVMGHTHWPFVRKVGGKLIVNVGSCGLPRDYGSLASCAVYDTLTNECRIYRLQFDGEKMISKYGEGIHKKVAECLRRTSGESIVGEVVE